jgi:DNA-binding beta-propeller fold protein YncE
MAQRIVIALVAMLVVAGPAHAGGTIRGFVLLPAEGRVALVDTNAGRVVSTMPVPHGAGTVVASIDGSRVLVANARRGLVTESDGVTRHRVRTFSGLGRPIGLLLVPRTDVGYVRARYAIVLDALGWLHVLDLDRGRVVDRLAIHKPTHFALAADHLWVTSAGSSRLTQIDASAPDKLHVVGGMTSDGVPVAIAPDPSGLTDVDIATADGTIEQIDWVTLKGRVVRRLSGRVTQLLPGYQGVMWVAETDGRVLGIRTADGTTTSIMRVPAGSRVAIVGGWLSAIHAKSLRMLDLGTSRHGATTTFASTAGSFSYAVLP